MSFCIDLGAWGDIFAVPKDVVDKHIKLANVMQIKTLLYVLRHSSEQLSSETIAKALSKHPDDINDSLQYWVENKIIKKCDDVYTPADEPKEDTKVTRLISVSDEHKTSEEKAIKKPSRSISRPQKPDSIFLAKRIKEEPKIAMLMQEAQEILGKPISTADSSTLLMLYDTDGLPIDVILMLMQYCVSIDKANMRYIEKMGIRWSDEEIDSIKKAEEKITSLDNTSKAWKIVVRTMGIDYHSPTANESKFSNRWINEWKFSSDMIREAYERCVDNTGKVTFRYINKILDSWQKEGIKSIDATRVEKKKIKKNIEEKTQSYNIEEYENSSIFD